MTRGRIGLATFLGVLTLAIVPAASSSSRVVEIPAADGTPLKATYYAGAPHHPAVLLLHECNADRKAWDPLGKALAAQGIHALALDYRGYGDSGGPRFTSLGPVDAQQMVNGRWPGDIDKAVAFLLAQPGVDGSRIGVGGGSCGVSQAVLTASRHSQVRSLVLLAGPPNRESRRFLVQHPWMPVFASAAAHDQFDADPGAQMRWVTELGGNPRSTFVGFSGTEHGSAMFAPHPELVGDIAKWFTETLITRVADPKAAGVPRATPVREFWTRVERGDVSGAVAYYHASIKSDPHTYLFPEAALNLAGYEALQATKPQDAIALFVLNTEAYPRSANAYDSLGDGYLAAGETALALTASEKALTLLSSEPLNERFKEAIRESAQQKIDKLRPAAGSAFQIPPTDDGLPGAGPIRRYDWFQQVWRDRRSAWAATRDKDHGAVVFLGDSITQGWEAGLPAAFPGLKIANRGINGDTSRGVLIRLKDDVLSLDPAAIVLLIGTNDLEESASADVITGNLKLILAAIEQHTPRIPIVLCEVFPSSATKKRPSDQIKAINASYLAAVKGDSQVTVIDTWRLFMDANGDAPASEFPDLLHPNEAGYAKWAAALRPVLATLGLIETKPEAFGLEAGFESLFNGSDLTGWGYRPTSESDRVNAKKWQASDPNAAAWPFVDQPINFDGLSSTPDGRFRAIAGRLVVTTPPEGRKIQQLWTTREFGDDFILKLEFRATPNADSGVYLRGPQLQCRDYGLAGPYKDLKRYKPQDWNELVVIVHGGVAVATANGELLESAFKLPPSGPIGVEGDRGQMEYRLIRIKRLPSSSPVANIPELDLLREFAARYTAAWCSHDASRVAALYTPDGSLTINDAAPSTGRSAITAAAQGFMSSFPDMTVQMDAVEIEEGRPVYRWTLIGTNTGPGGTGRAVRISGYERWQLGAGGLIIESRGHFDAADYQRQLDGRQH